MLCTENLLQVPTLISVVAEPLAVVHITCSHESFHDNLSANPYHHLGVTHILTQCLCGTRLC